MKTIDEAIRLRPDGFTDRSIYTDPAILDQEIEKIFKKTWVLIGHETEIPEPDLIRPYFLSTRSLSPVTTCVKPLPVSR